MRDRAGDAEAEELVPSGTVLVSPAAFSAAVGPASRAFIAAVAGIVVCATRRSATPSFSSRRKYSLIVVTAGAADGDAEGDAVAVAAPLGVTVAVAVGPGRGAAG